MTANRQLLRIPEVAEMLGFDRRHVYKLVKRGCFKPRFVGIGTKRRYMRLLRREVENFIEKGQGKVR